MWEGSSMGGGALQGSQAPLSRLNLHFSVIKPCSGFQQGLEASLLSGQGRRMRALLNLGHQDGPEGLMWCCVLQPSAANLPRALPL